MRTIFLKASGNEFAFKWKIAKFKALVCGTCSKIIFSSKHTWLHSPLSTSFARVVSFQEFNLNAAVCL